MPNSSLLGEDCLKCKGTRKGRCQLCRGSGFIGGDVAQSHEGRPVSDRIAVIIPTQQTTIEPNEEINARLLLEIARPEAIHAGVRVALI